MRNKLINWLLFTALCCIWGSSFILMKFGMSDAALAWYHVAALRMFFSGFIMLPFFIKALKQLPKPIIRYVLLSGWLGSFFPAFLFCLAETKIDSAIAGGLNSLTPLFVIITGALMFRVKSSQQQVLGVVVGLLGCTLLTYINAKSAEYIAYSGLVLIATFFYGVNVNMVHEKLQGVSSVQIAAVAFSGLIIPALLVLIFTGYFNLPLTQPKYLEGTLSGAVLGIINTSLASVLFYMLIKRAGGLLASLVTYGVPFIAILCGIYFYGEVITYVHIIALVIILLGVYIAYRQKKS